MNRAWLVKNDGSFEIYYGEKPYWNDEIEMWDGRNGETVDLDILPLTDDLLRRTEKDEPIEIVYAPIDKVKVEIGKEFFNILADKMRVLWPQGDKDGKYAWREPVPALAKRLETLWSIRNLGQFNIDDCLKVCRAYLAEYEHENVKYMQVVKYFVLKQKEIVDKGGRIRYISTSRFADMLEGIKASNDNQEFEALISGSKTDNLI